MVHGDVLRQLFRGHAERDDSAFRSAAEALIREERLHNHRLLADDLERILFTPKTNGNARRNSRPSPDVPKDRERGFPLVDVTSYSYDWSRLVVPARTQAVLQTIADEHQRSGLLATAGLRPTQKVLFYGPAGCGKTLAAQVLASVLDLPLVLVRFDAVVSSFLGETAANLRRVFDFVEKGRWVVLFDEFDAIGKSRDNLLEHGELKRVVNSLLQLMDAYRGESLLIAATNHEGLLDTAVWRRFESVVAFEVPSNQDRLLLIRSFLRGFNTSTVNLDALARCTRGATGADLERIAIEAARRAVLDGRTELTKEDIDAAVVTFKERLRLGAALRPVSDDSTEVEE